MFCHSNSKVIKTSDKLHIIQNSLPEQIQVDMWTTGLWLVQLSPLNISWLLSLERVLLDLLNSNFSPFGSTTPFPGFMSLNGHTFTITLIWQTSSPKRTVASSLFVAVTYWALGLLSTASALFQASSRNLSMTFISSRRSVFSLTSISIWLLRRPCALDHFVSFLFRSSFKSVICCFRASQKKSY